MEKLEFKISLATLKEQEQLFTYKVTSSFFQDISIFGNIKSIEVNINFTTKKDDLLISFNSEFSGIIATSCDRCLDSLTHQLNYTDKGFLKLTKENDTNDFPKFNPTNQSIELDSYFKDIIVTSSPITFKHKKIEECNQEIIKNLSNHNKPLTNFWVLK